MAKMKKVGGKSVDENVAQLELSYSTERAL